LKVFFNNIQTLLIVALVIIIILLRSCNGGGNSVGPKIVTTIETKYDTIQTIKETYVPKWKTKTVTKVITNTITEVDTFQQPIDTLAILQDYYTKYFYQDTIQIDTIGYAIINDTITKNSIFSRDIKTSITFPTTTITDKIYLNKIEFYAGLGVVGGLNQLNYIGGEVLLRTRKRTIYGLGLGIDQSLQPALSGRMYWKIGKK
tara:strand:+ start:737 stop:1345 length:609 start_codon:yes stop_codon:yes gene_type:complete